MLINVAVTHSLSCGKLLKSKNNIHTAVYTKYMYSKTHQSIKLDKVLQNENIHKITFQVQTESIITLQNPLPYSLPVIHHPPKVTTILYYVSIQ